MLIFKLLTPSERAALASAGSTRGSARDVTDGYVHLSTAATLPGTLSKHYASVPRLVLLAVDAAAVGPALRWEPARGGTLFPHLYRTLDAADVVWERELTAIDGVHTLPQEALEGAGAGADVADGK